jgi:hypothetical protein
MTSSRTLKATLYPMAGAVAEQSVNLLRTLRWLDTRTATPKDVYEWLRTTFNLAPYFARDVYTVILISSGLVDVQQGKCQLTRDGRAVLDSGSPVVLLEVFENQFAAVATVLEVLRARNNVTAEVLKEAWFETVKERFPRMKSWGGRTLSNQCRHRINWLRAMGLIESKRGKYSLSDAGWKLIMAKPPEAIAIQSHEVKRQEKVLRKLTLGKFEAFDTSATRKGTLREAFVRDAAFREVVVRQYDYHCAICDFSLATPKGQHEAEAAHIVPKSKRGSDDPRNGICLCGTHHWTFDEGVISVHPEDLTVITAAFLTNFSGDESAQSVLQLEGRKIRSVVDRDYKPSDEALGWHNKNIFLG